MQPSSSDFTISVALTPGESYPIHIDKNLLENSSLIQRYLVGKQVFLVASHNIPKIYLENIQRALNKIETIEQLDCITVADQDENKSLEAANDLWSQLIKLGHRRDTTLVAVGGGVIGDLVGFVASCYLRGVAWIDFPTTLLAQVDAAIGGKVAVNHPLGKNLIGAFYSPKAVLSDLKTLHTLTERDYIAGLAEVLKYGLALDKDLANWLQENVLKILDREFSTLAQLVSWCSKIKADIVSKDFKESHTRMLLNFGHTIGHAIETASGYSLKHGEAVSLGIRAALEISKDYGLSQPEFEQSIQLLEMFKLPTKLKAKMKVGDLLQIMSRDKKNLSGQRSRFIVLKALGHSECVEGVPEAALVNAMRQLGAV